MIYKKERHKQQVIRSRDLKNQGKTLFRENPEEYSELLDYEIAVEEQIFWTNRGEFFLVMKDFLDNIINFDEFETAFTLLYHKTREEFDMFVIDLKQIEKFQPSTRLDRFAGYINAIFREFEALEDEYCTEQDIKNYVKEVYLKFGKYLNEVEVNARIDAEIEAEEAEIKMEANRKEKILLERVTFFGLVSLIFYSFLKSELFDLYFNFIN